ncbi:MAG: helix-turn-helix domain-containing protein [Ruminococcaceae bacterium]|nr:helix-turn-helix domain-containing protein [Oscillospiraceae bacterium]
MIYETTIYLGKKTFNVIMQSGFYERKKLTTDVHKHRYGEIHLISGEGAIYEIDGKILEIEGNSGVYIPPLVFHRCLNAKGNTHCIAFQLVGAEYSELSVKNFPQSVVGGLIKSADMFFKNGSEDELILYLSLIVSGFNKAEGEKAITAVKNREFLIYEFFANNYKKDITLKDLADELHLSEKQASRIIEKYTGNNFRTEILKRKMEAAKYLMESKNLSLEEVASEVGYSSYGGFWKAFKDVYGKDK